MAMNRKPIFDAVRKMLDRSYTEAEVKALDKAITAAEGSLKATETPASPPSPPPPPPPPPAPAGKGLGEAGAKLIKKWEGCHKLRADGRFDAYPDPGSVDGKPWTIGWGSTGADVKKGVVWTKAECDARFETDMLRYVSDVVKTLGTSPTSQNQFDALVSFHYNTGAIATATLTKLHKQGKFAEAQAQFARWVRNDGRVMQGLVNRRKDEAKLYATA